MRKLPDSCAQSFLASRLYAVEQNGVEVTSEIVHPVGAMQGKKSPK